MPIDRWGPLRGYDRFVARQVAWRHRRLVVSPPRRRPKGLVLAGGAQNKILSRRHARLVVDAMVGDPALRRFLRTCWTPDEVAIPSILCTPNLGGDWLQTSVPGPPLWYIDWGRMSGLRRPKNPRWLSREDLPAIREAAARDGVPAIFARKFASDDSAVLDLIDAQLGVREL